MNIGVTVDLSGVGNPLAKPRVLRFLEIVYCGVVKVERLVFYYWFFDLSSPEILGTLVTKITTKGEIKETN